jgi:hypothetical protein
MDGMITACAKYDDLAKSTRAEVEKALAGTDTSDLRASFRRALSFSTPPLTLYRNNRASAYSELIFGVPLVDLETNQDNVPKVMRMCIEEVEKRGLNTKSIYSVGHSMDKEVLQLRRRFESEKRFSLNSKDDIHSIAMLHLRYLEDLPEPLFMLSVQDYGKYQTEYSEHNCSVLRSTIRQLHPVQRASLGALLRHLFLVASHSDKNTMTVKALVDEFCFPVLRGSRIFEDGVDLKSLVMEDLIRNVHTLFDDRLSPYPPAEVVSVQPTSAAEWRLEVLSLD